jgi:anti-anti-sigma factor
VSELPGAPFELAVSSAEGAVRVVSLKGELDFDEAPTFARTLDELRADGARDLVVDLAELTFIDSSGISVLVSTARAAASDGGMLVVASPASHVRRVFEIVNLSELMPVEVGLDEALQRIARERQHAAG